MGMSIKAVKPDRTDVILAMREPYMTQVVDGVKTYEFRRYRLPDTICRVWFYSTRPISAIEYVCEISPARTRTQILSRKRKRTEEETSVNQQCGQVPEEIESHDMDMGHEVKNCRCNNSEESKSEIIDEKRDGSSTKENTYINSTPIIEDGLGNKEFNTFDPEWKGYDYAYRILSVWKLKQKLELNTLKNDYGFKGAVQGMMYVPDTLSGKIQWNSGLKIR